MTTPDCNRMDEAIESSLAAIDAGWATTDQIRRANAWRKQSRPQIGKLALFRDKLTMAEVFSVLSKQAVEGGLFGEIAVELGLLDNNELCELLGLQMELTPTMADALVSTNVITPAQAAIASQSGWSVSGNQSREPALACGNEFEIGHL